MTDTASCMNCGAWPIPLTDDLCSDCSDMVGISRIQKRINDVVYEESRPKLITKVFMDGQEVTSHREFYERYGLSAKATQEPPLYTWQGPLHPYDEALVKEATEKFGVDRVTVVRMLGDAYAALDPESDTYVYRPLLTARRFGKSGLRRKPSLRARFKAALWRIGLLARPKG